MNNNKSPRYAFAYARVSDPRQAQKDVSIPELLKEKLFACFGKLMRNGDRRHSL